MLLYKGNVVATGQTRGVVDKYEEIEQVNFNG
jgi:hypothetical protein